MEAYDDRPISVYDNLNMPAAMQTSTPKAKLTITTTPAAAASAATSSTSPATVANGDAPRSPYADISFKFNDNKSQIQQQQQLQQQHPLPNGNRSLNQSQLQQQHQQQPQTPSSPMHHHHQPTNSPYYATPFKTATTTTTSPPSTAIAAAAAAAATPTAATNAAVAAAAVSPTVQTRPLSQHSQSEPHEAGITSANSSSHSQSSIAAVKAALNDAKSKFFGLNGYAPDSLAHVHARAPLHESQPTYKLLPATVPPSLPPSTKPQPKYQNIPENSAIYRQASSPTPPPPELPPKPSPLHHDNSTTPSPQPPLTSPSTVLPTSSSSPQPSSSSGMALPNSTPAAKDAINIVPYAAYKQIPLNDIDGPQPSQAVYMSTTVPQNIKGSKIAGRHTPTRNSLRHSRMLVVNNKNYQGIQHPNPMNFKQPQLARWLLILEIIIGLLLSFLATWIFFLSPNTAVQDNPYWSGLALLLAGILGLVLIRYQRIKRRKVRENCFIFLRADSWLLSMLAVLLCAVALVCAALHFVRLTASDTKCESTNMLLEHGSCSCTFNAFTAATPANATRDDDSNGLLDEEPAADFEPDRSYKVEYRDLSCSEVNGEWKYILGISFVLNALGFLVAVLYIVLLACCRHNSKRFYSSVHTSTF